MIDSRTAPSAGDRLAKVIARAGLCSRRDAEGWITAGRISVNGKKVLTPAFNVTERDRITVDGEPLTVRQGTRMWLYHKSPGLVVTEKDPEGRPTIFEDVESKGLPRVLSVGRLDINTEGLLLLTNDGGLKRVLELPETGWLRRYRARAHGRIKQADLDALKNGIEVNSIRYGEIEATLEREQGTNVWLTLALREGKNREVRNVLEALGLTVNRLIRISYGPFQLGDIAPGAIETVKARVLRDQLGKRLAEAAGVDFESEMPELDTARRSPRDRHVPHHKTRGDREAFSGRPETRRGMRLGNDDRDVARPRRIHFEDGRESEDAKPSRSAAPGRRDDRRGPPRRDFDEKTRRPEGDAGPRPPHRRRDSEAGGQADGRQMRPWRGDRMREDDDRPGGGPGRRQRGNRDAEGQRGSGRPSGKSFAGKPRSGGKSGTGARPAEGGRSGRPGGDRPKAGARSPGSGGLRPPGARPAGPRKGGGDRPRGPRR